MPEGCWWLSRGALAAPLLMTDPLPEPVSRPVARCIARARDGDGGEGKSAGGPMQETPHPQERASKARGTECGNFDGAAPSHLTGDFRHPADHHQRTPGTRVLIISSHAVIMIIMAKERPFAEVWFVRNMCASF